MMTEIIIGIAALAIIAGFTFVVRMFLKRLHDITTLYERTGVSPENPVLPEAYILRFKPVPVTIQGKTLYIQPLKLEGHKAYTKSMLTFLASFQKQLGGIRLMMLSDLLKQMEDTVVTDEWMSLQYNTDMFNAMITVVEKTFLKSKAVNPQHITARFIRKNWTWVEVCQVFQMCYAVQVQSCQDFIQYLLEGQRAGAGKQNAGSPLQKPLVTPCKSSQTGPLTPRYSSSRG